MAFNRRPLECYLEPSSTPLAQAGFFSQSDIWKVICKILELLVTHKRIGREIHL